MGSSATLFLTLSIISLLTPSSTSLGFNCSSATSCRSLIDYKSPNTTSLSTIKTLFGIKNFRALLGANNYPQSRSPNFTILSGQTIKIPFPCICTNGSGISNGVPVYTVQKDDGLYHIAAEVFSGLVTYPQIQQVNNISNENLIEIGQELWIPLPCSCDKVGGVEVVHYGHVVASGSSVEQIAQEFSTTQETLLKLNGIADAKDLQAGAVLDVPLKACTTSIRNDSLDSPLLVANNTYIYTANSCVRCTCSSANNWILQCEPSQSLPANGTCSSMQCQGSGSLYIGNMTTSSCNTTTCAYAGYTNQTILTSLVSQSTCPASDGNAVRIGLKGLSWSSIFISIHLVVLCLHLL